MHHTRSDQVLANSFNTRPWVPPPPFTPLAPTSPLYAPGLHPELVPGVLSQDQGPAAGAPVSPSHPSAHPPCQTVFLMSPCPGNGLPGGSPKSYIQPQTPLFECE